MATIQFVKGTALCMNVLVFIIGVVISVCGFILRFNSGLMERDVITLFNYIEYNNIRIGSTIAVIDYSMIIAGGLLAITAIFGFVGAWKKIRCCLLLYVIIAIVMILVQATAVGLWISVRGRTNEWLKGQMMHLLTDYKGHTASDEISDGFNTLFIEGRCCAVNAYGGGLNDFESLPAQWWPVRGNNLVPPTCCQGVTKDTVSDYDNSVSCTNTPSNYYTEGCYDLVVYYVNTYSMILFVAAAVLLAVEIVAMICACMLMDKIKNRISPGDAVMKKRSR